jgi:hypothetical protein
MLRSVQDTTNIKAFYRIYKPVFEETQKINAVQIAQPALTEGFKRFHYYFPKYPLTHQIILFVGPFEQFGNIVTKDAVAVGLQMHMGTNSKWYATDQMQTMYPHFLSLRFTPQFIAVNSLQNILNDYSALNEQGNLLTQMIEMGKRQFILKACLPNVPDSILLGYTNAQLQELNKNASKIWEYIMAQKLIYSNNESDINSFLQEGDTNEIFGESFPGNVGKWIVFQIVNSWMQQKAQAQVSMETLLRTPAQQIFSAAQYAP